MSRKIRLVAGLAGVTLACAVAAPPAPRPRLRARLGGGWPALAVLPARAPDDRDEAVAPRAPHAADDPVPLPDGAKGARLGPLPGAADDGPPAADDGPLTADSLHRA